MSSTLRNHFRDHRCYTVCRSDYIYVEHSSNLSRSNFCRLLGYPDSGIRNEQIDPAKVTAQIISSPSRRATSPSLAPRRAKANDSPLPIPDEAPVIITTLS